MTIRLLLTRLRTVLRETPTHDILTIADFIAFVAGLVLLVSTDPNLWVWSTRFTALFLLYLGLRRYMEARLTR